MVDLLLELFEYCWTIVPGRESAPLMAYRGCGSGRFGGRATCCLKSGLERVGEKQRSKGKGTVAGLGTRGIRAAFGEDG